MTKRCGIVGGGLASLVAYATLRKGGLEPAEIAVFATDADPTADFRRRAAAIRQSHMRSESDGHAAATSWPGLAVWTALRRGNPVPLVATLFDRYHPRVGDFLDHATEVRERTGWDESVVLGRIRRIAAVEGGFELDGYATVQHALLAPGHPGLALPSELAEDSRVVHAYEPHEYADDVTVIGAGMAAATEWLNALATGARVVSIRRRAPERRPLNLPRTLFTRRGLAAFHRTAPPERIAFLRRWSTPSYPSGPSWDEPIDKARANGRFRVEAELNGADQIICATGFKRGYRQDALLSRLASEHALETAEDWIILAPDSTVPALTDSERTLALAGIPAQWAFPAADTLAGAKYAARRFLRRVSACPTR